MWRLTLRSSISRYRRHPKNRRPDRTVMTRSGSGGPNVPESKPRRTALAAAPPFQPQRWLGDMFSRIQPAASNVSHDLFQLPKVVRAGSTLVAAQSLHVEINNRSDVKRQKLGDH